MKAILASFSLLAICALIGASIWATQHAGISAAISELMAQPAAGNVNPWFVATLFDTYFGFLWFWLWVAYREPNKAVSALWLLLILGLGNMAMGAYMLLALWRLPAGADAQALLRRKAT